MSAAEVSLSASAIAARRSWVSRVTGSEVSTVSAASPDDTGLRALVGTGVSEDAVTPAALPSAIAEGGRGGGPGIGREALAGAKPARSARSAAEIWGANGLSDCMTYYKGPREYPARQEKSEIRSRALRQARSRRG